MSWKTSLLSPSLSLSLSWLNAVIAICMSVCLFVLLPALSCILPCASTGGLKHMLLLIRWLPKQDLIWRQLPSALPQGPGSGAVLRTSYEKLLRSLSDPGPWGRHGFNEQSQDCESVMWLQLLCCYTSTLLMLRRSLFGGNWQLLRSVLTWRCRKI